MTSLIACDCVAFEMFKALVMVKLLDSEEEEETEGRGMTRSWLKKREELGYFTNVRELQLEDTEGFKEMMRMDFKHFNEVLNLIAPDITIFFLKCRSRRCARKRIQHHPT